MDDKKIRLDELLIKHKVQPVGSGYIDCIVKKENLADFLNDLDEIGIEVTGVGMWRHYTAENSEAHGCPHGGCAPQSRYHEGYFSEMYHMKFKNEIDSSADVLNYVFEECLNDEFYSPCVQPGLWLNVPEDWRNAEYKPPVIDEEQEAAKNKKIYEKETANMLILVSIGSLAVNAFLITVFQLQSSFIQPGLLICGIACGILGLRMKIRYEAEEISRGKKIGHFSKMFSAGIGVYFGVSIVLLFVLLPMIYISSC